MSKTDLKNILFEDPSSANERESEWDGPKGFMFGGMSNLTESNLSQIGEQYFRAANALLLIIKRNEVADFELQNPVFYLFRQCMELMVKATLMGEGKSLLDSKNRNIHSLKILLDRLGNVPSDYYSLIEQLHEIDPGSTLLRYGGEKPFFNGEMWCSLEKLEFQMTRLYIYLNNRHNK